MEATPAEAVMSAVAAMTLPTRSFAPGINFACKRRAVFSVRACEMGLHRGTHEFRLVVVEVDERYSPSRSAKPARGRTIREGTYIARQDPWQRWRGRRSD